MIDNFGSDTKTKYTYHEGKCYLKTKTGKLKQHHAIVMGNEIYFYRRQEEARHRIMHCLVGIFITMMEEE